MIRIIHILLLCAATANAQVVSPKAPQKGRHADVSRLLSPETWKLDATQSMARAQPLGLRWLSTNQDTALARHAGLHFAGLRIIEAQLHFKDSRPAGLDLSVYNRGDAGALHHNAFKQVIGQTSKHLDAWTDSRGVVLRDAGKTSRVKINRMAWVKGPHRLDLVYSFTNYNGTIVPEYLRLSITPFNPNNDPRKLRVVNKAPAKVNNVHDLRKNIARDPNGDVYVGGLPMVDQGKKGYCAVASAERILRYFGRSFDQHELAQIAGSSASRGTSTDAMLDALRRVARSNDLRVNVLEELTVKEAETQVKRHNQITKKKGGRQLPGGYQVYLSWMVMDPAIQKEVRLKSRTGLNQFLAQVKKHVNGGVPLTWGLVVGKVPEQPKTRGIGGHMRLIIGYNDQTSEILFSDSWGRGHEKKRMKIEDAWTVTMGLYSVLPDNVRI